MLLVEYPVFWENRRSSTKMVLMALRLVCFCLFLRQGGEGGMDILDDVMYCSHVPYTKSYYYSSLSRSPWVVRNCDERSHRESIQLQVDTKATVTRGTVADIGGSGIQQT